MLVTSLASCLCDTIVGKPSTHPGDAQIESPDTWTLHSQNSAVYGENEEAASTQIFKLQSGVADLSHNCNREARNICTMITDTDK